MRAGDRDRINKSQVSEKCVLHTAEIAPRKRCCSGGATQQHHRVGPAWDRPSTVWYTPHDAGLPQALRHSRPFPPRKQWQAPDKTMLTKQKLENWQCCVMPYGIEEPIYIPLRNVGTSHARAGVSPLVLGVPFIQPHAPQHTT